MCEPGWTPELGPASALTIGIWRGRSLWLQMVWPLMKAPLQMWQLQGRRSLGRIRGSIVIYHWTWKFSQKWCNSDSSGACQKSLDNAGGAQIFDSPPRNPQSPFSLGFNSRLSFSYLISSQIHRFSHDIHSFSLAFGKILCNINTWCYLNIGAVTVHLRVWINTCDTSNSLSNALSFHIEHGRFHWRSH